MRRRLSTLHPWLYSTRVAELRLERRVADRLRRVRFARHIAPTPLPVVLVHHSSVLRRQLLDLDPRLQESKIVNLRLAVASIDGLVIGSGETFSFWERIGPPTAARGFVEGLILRRGRIEAGVGGGLCQLSNLLYWMALHTPLEIAERHHHGFDPFPDSGRVLPFGSGATVFYNYGDLRLTNPTSQPMQLAVRVGEKDLVGAIATDRPWPLAYHVEEVGHRFARAPTGAVFRDNELWRRSVDRHTGRTLDRQLVTRNHSLVTYAVAEDQLDARAPDDGASLRRDGRLRAR